jgi:hypothetical protein
MTRDEWLRYGYEQGFCGAEICATHDGLPTSATEDETDEDLCIWVVRMFADETERGEVEENHSPSVWRK